MGKRTRVLVIVFVVLAILVAAILGFNFSRSNGQPVDESGESGLETDEERGIKLAIDYGNDDTALYVDLLVEEGQSLFDVLFNLSENGDITLSYEDFGGDLGVFIEGINGVGLSEEGGSWWQYWVNGEYGEVGMSNYFPTQGDSIVLKYTDSQL